MPFTASLALGAVMQKVEPANPGDAPFAVEDCLADTNSLIKLLKDSGGIVAQSDLKVVACWLCLATARLPGTQRQAVLTPCICGYGQNHRTTFSHARRR